MSNTTRMRHKNEGIDSKELRRRREEESLQFRKQKRDIQLFKRRNINNTIQMYDDNVSVTRAGFDFRKPGAIFFGGLLQQKI